MPYCPECSASTPEGANRCPTCGAALVATPTTESLPGTGIQVDVDALQVEIADSIAPQYELLKPLGAGGMGAVFLAREPALKRLVAVKVLTPQLASDARARARFEREARAAAALSHPNIVRVYAVGTTRTQGLPYIVMQYVQGPTLALWMTQRRRVGERDARRVIGEVASALAAAHVRDLVHRDVKPSNVLLEMETGRPFVVDFGVSAALSRASDETKLTATGAVVGTPVYMSPEQASGDTISAKSDVYSLGVMAYELLTGEPPFQASTAMGWAAAHLRDTPTPVGRARRGLSPELARIVDRCLSKDPDQRPSAADVARGFLPTLDTEIEWPPPGLAPFRGRGRTLGMMSLVVAAAGIWTLFALAFTPDVLRVHPGWLSTYQSLIEGAGGGTGTPIGTGAASSAVTMWQMLTVLGAAGFLLGLVAFLLQGARVVTDAARHLRLGWHPLTVVDVAVDDDGNSGLLVAGTREFASLDRADRRRVLRARRLQSGASLFAGVWVGGVILVWFAILAITGDADGYGLAVGSGLWYVAMLPTLLVVTLGLVGAIVEARILGPLRRRRTYEAGIDELQGWYRALPPDAALAPLYWAPARATVLGVQISLIVLGLAAATAVAEAVLATFAAGEATRRTGTAMAELSSTLAEVHARDPLGQLREVLTPYMPERTVPYDSAARLLARRLMGADNVEPLEDIPAPLPRLRLADGDRSQSVERLFLDAIAGRIPDDTLRILEQLATHPRLLAMRRLALVDSLQFLDAWLDRPLADYQSWWGMPWPRVGGVRMAALANAAVAAMATGRGRFRDAEERLGEDAAVYMAMLDDPTSLAGLVAARELRSTVLRPLAVLEQRRGNTEQARRLREAAQSIQSLLDAFRLLGAVGFAADPADLSTYSDLVLDQTLPPGWRIGYFGAVWVGACTNPREILLGPDPRRREAALRAAQAMQDIPEALTIVQLERNELEATRGIGPPSEGVVSRLQHLMPWRVASTLALCGSAQ